MMSSNCLLLPIAVCAVAMSANVNAAEYYRAVTVTQVASISNVRPALPETAGIIRVYVTSAAWGSSSCRTDAFDIRGDDYLNFSLLMQAWKDQKPLTVWVDDSLHIAGADSTCAATAVRAG